MDKQIYLPIMTGLLFGAFGALVFSPSAYTVWGFAFATFAWAIATGMCRQSQDNDYDEFMKNQIEWRANHQKIYENNEERLKDLHKQLDSVRTAINMKQLGR